MGKGRESEHCVAHNVLTRYNSFPSAILQRLRHHVQYLHTRGSGTGLQHCKNQEMRRISTRDISLIDFSILCYHKFSVLVNLN